MKKEPIGWKHPLFIIMVFISLIALALVIWVSPLKAQTETLEEVKELMYEKWLAPDGWGVANQKPASHIMDMYYDYKSQYGYGESEVVWRGLLAQGVWKQWTYIDQQGCDNYWGFWFDVPNKLYLLPRFQIEVEVEGGERYYSDQYIISLGNGGVAYIVDYGDMTTHTIINNTYDGSHGFTLIMARFPWGRSVPKQIIRYRFRGFMYP